jgi:hypothetical protein
MPFKLLLIALTGSLLVGCSNENTPEEVTKAFVKAWAAKDYEEAKKYATKDSHTAIDAVRFASALLQKNKPVEVTHEDVTCKTEGNTAKCRFCCATGYENMEYELVQEDGEWKVVFKNVVLNDIKNAVTEEGIKQAEESLKDLKNAVDTLVSK